VLPLASTARTSEKKKKSKGKDKAKNATPKRCDKMAKNKHLVELALGRGINVECNGWLCDICHADNKARKREEEKSRSASAFSTLLLSCRTFVS